MLGYSPASRDILPIALTLLASLAFDVIARDAVAEESSDAGKVEFFENRVRPVLARRCYECHNSASAQEGGLALDHRAAVLAGGDNGAVLVPGKPDESRLLKTIRHELDGLEMPQGEEKLSDAQIADFERWIADGAVDPRDAPPTEELATALDWETVFARRKESWRFRPPVASPAPPVANETWPAGDVDRFLLARMEAAGLAPSPEADRRTLLRRLSFVLTGLPPTREEIAAFLADQAPGAYERQVDRLLDSSAYGERLARHWMDWMRYAETHGSEGDPTIPFAWRYRDYLIQALNDDVPADRLILEQVAGDLAGQPRLDERGVDQASIGPAQFRMVQHGFAPTDALDEQVRFVDNQIDVVTKAFQGLTVSCARCHDHKFDAISQADYYALFGTLAGGRPATVTVDSPDRDRPIREGLERLKREIRAAVAEDWRRAAADVPSAAAWTNAVDGASEPIDPLHAWRELKDLSGDAFAAKWNDLARAAAESRARLDRRIAPSPGNSTTGWRLGDLRHFAAWTRHGSGLAGDAPASGGVFFVKASGDVAIDGPYPAGVYSHGLSDKSSGFVGSPRFVFDRKYVYLRVVGDGEARARYVVRNYPRGGTVYPIERLNGGEPEWIRWDVGYWSGDEGYLEVSTAADQPVEGDPAKERSSFGVLEARLVDEEQVAAGEAPRDEIAEFAGPLFEREGAPTNVDELRERYRAALLDAIAAFAGDSMTDAQALFLRSFVRRGLLPGKLDELPTARPLLVRYREVEATLPVPTRAPGVIDADPRDQVLYVRGDHKQPADPVERRFLSAVDSTPYRPAGSGRLELARSLVDPANPLTSRVLVNRIWHHVFGRGLVATPDNFGALGEQPSHPGLLDTLAVEFASEGWSTKRLVRKLVLSRAFRGTSDASPEALAVDPNNLLLSRMSVRRLEAEAVRDALLAAAGKLDLQTLGPPQGEDSARRSVYVAQRRNAMPPLLAAFDAPVPFSTVGRRDATNVPAQSLALLNDSFVAGLARSWAASAVPAPRDVSPAQRTEIVAAMFETALGRVPDASETDLLLAYLDASESAQTERIARSDDLRRKLRSSRERRERLVAPVRASLTGTAASETIPRNDDLRPIARWEFDGDGEDAVGDLDATLHGDAAIVGGALTLDGDAYASAGPLPGTLGAKTLEAWVALDDLDQRGGGVLSVQSADGARFDAIVFAEQAPRKWLAGSDFFRRTRSFDGLDERDAARRPIHIAIAYAADGAIAAYRDGVPYGTSYDAGDGLTFLEGEATILFGLRHAPPGGDRHFAGRILRAALYDRALTPEEIALAAKATPAFVDDAAILAALPEVDGERVVALDRELADLERSIAEIPEADRAFDQRRAWSDLALAIFNFKEFVYLR